MNFKIIFVLVEAAVPQNVGFAARAIKTMGFGEMRLVNACDHLSKGARTTGYGSHDILEAATTYSSIPEALDDIDLTIGTTAKKRISRHDLFDVKQLNNLIENKAGSLNSVAVVFGSEEHGLTKEQLELCDVVSSVPLATKYPSLNLAQAILIYAYELSSVRVAQKPKLVEKRGLTEQKAVKEKAADLLKKLGVQKQPSLHQRLKDRLMTAGTEDIRLMLSLMKYIEKRL